MKIEAKTPEAFEKWMKEGPKRAPWMFKEQGAEKAGPDSIAGNVATPRPLVKPGSKPWSNTERLDWAEKASGAGNEDWDGKEPLG